MMRDPRASIGEGVVFDCWHKKARVGWLPACLAAACLPACLAACLPARPPLVRPRPPAVRTCLLCVPACLQEMYNATRDLAAVFNGITDEQQEVEVVSAGGRQWLHSLH
jgi:hypothetical protein